MLVGDEKIVISTVHKAKGRQFDAVVIPGAGEMSEGGPGADRDEAQRLLYVAMSRAKRHLTLLGCGMGGIWRGLGECFRAGYSGYYLRRARGEDLSSDWLNQWEVLAEAKAEGRCPMEVVESALASKVGPVVRMALKTLRHHPDRVEAIRRWRGCLATANADAAIACLREAGVYDSETIHAVRKSFLASKEERDHRASLEYFKTGCECATERRSELLVAIGDFIYHHCGVLRLVAATFLAEQGVLRWKGIVRGASTDFERLQQVADPEHEETLRLLLEKRLPDEYDRHLRTILFVRARRRLS